MTTTSINNTAQQRDRDMTEYLYSALRTLPETIGGIEAEAAALINVKRDAQSALDDAELNATMQASMATYKNADTMKQAIKNETANNPDVKRLKKEIVRIDNELEMNEAEAKSKRREFQAAIALAELHAARINMMYHYQNNNNHAERKQQ